MYMSHFGSRGAWVHGNTGFISIDVARQCFVIKPSIAAIPSNYDAVLIKYPVDPRLFAGVSCCWAALFQALDWFIVCLTASTDDIPPIKLTRGWVKALKHEWKITNLWLAETSSEQDKTSGLSDLWLKMICAASHLTKSTNQVIRTRLSKMPVMSFC